MSGNQVSNVRPIEQQYKTTTTTATSNDSQIPTALAGNADGTASSTTPKTGNNTTSENVQAKSENTMYNAIQHIIAGTDLSLEEVKQLLTKLNKDNKELDAETIGKVLNCLKYAIEDSKENGKVDREKLQTNLGLYILLTVKSDKKDRTCEDVRKMMSLSLLGMITAQNPNLKGKRIISKEEQDANPELKKYALTAEDIANTVKALLNDHLTPEKIQEIKENPDQISGFIRSVFSAGISKCTPEEIELLTEAFVKLLQDNNLQDEIQTIVTVVCNNLKDKPEELNKFINTTLVEILKKYNFTDKAIQKICESSLGAFLAKNPDKLGVLLNSGIQFLQQLKDSPDLPILLKVLDKHLNKELDNLTAEEKAVLQKYQGPLTQLIQVYALMAQKPDLKKQFEEKLKELNGLVNECGLGNYIYNSLQTFFENNQDLFQNCESKDDFTKILNEITNNKYSEAIGDTNPDNLYNGSNNDESTDIGFGMSQRVSYNDITMLTNSVEQKQAMLAENDDDDFFLIRNTRSGEEVTNPIQKFKSIANLSAKDLHEGLSKKYIKVGDILDEYENLTQSGKDFVEGLIAVMAPGQQNYFLNGIKNKNSVIIAIIRHVKIDVNKLNLSLDYANRKEVERIEKDREEAYK